MADARARALRKAMTPQEVKLWVHLRAWRREGFHFRRQVPLAGFIVDFACLRHSLVVEADGGGHARHIQELADRHRDAKLEISGFRVLRFWNRQIDTDLPGVLDAIYAELNRHPTPGLRPDPPRSGEG